MEENEIKKDEAVVLYCDGSCKAPPGGSAGDIGFGFHGYHFSMAPPKKGAGHPQQILTDTGYAPKDQKGKAKEVTPLAYISGIGSSDLKASNNVAELFAATYALEHATKYKPEKILLKTDSEYVRKGIQEWSHHWVRNRWHKRDGSPVPNAEHWKVLLAKINEAQQQGIKFDVKWVKGHKDSHGNILADKLAGIGSNNSKLGLNKIDVTAVQPEGFWKVDERPPFLSHSTMYFNTLKESQDKGEYFLGPRMKEDQLPGNSDADACYAVVQLSEPVVALELIKKYQSELTGDYDRIVQASLDTLFGANRAKELEMFGVGALNRSSGSWYDLEFVDKEPVTTVPPAPLLIDRVVTACSILKGILNIYREKLSSNTEKPQAKVIKFVDITDSIFDTVETTVKKEVKKEKKLKAEFIVGYKTHTVKVETPFGERDIKLILSMDLPERNALKRLEGSDPKVVFVSWPESEQAFRYACIVHTDKDYGIWAGYYSNLVLVPSQGK